MFKKSVIFALVSLLFVSCWNHGSAILKTNQNNMYFVLFLFCCWKAQIQPWPARAGLGSMKIINFYDKFIKFTKKHKNVSKSQNSLQITKLDRKSKKIIRKTMKQQTFTWILDLLIVLQKYTSLM